MEMAKMRCTAFSFFSNVQLIVELFVQKYINHYFYMKINHSYIVKSND